MARTADSRGIAHPGVIAAILVVVAAIAFGGWYVWDRNKDDKVADNSGNNSQTNSTQNQNEEQSDPSEGGKYLVIKEWGDRFELPEELRGDVEYGIFTLNNGDQIAYFASKKIASKSTYGCGLEHISDSSGTGMFGGAIAISRTATEPEETAKELKSERGDYWYATGFSNGGECYEGDTGQETGAFKSAMEAAIRKLEPIE